MSGTHTSTGTGRGLVAARPLLPASVYYAVVFGIPMLMLLGLSFWRAQGFTLIPDFTLDNYVKIFANPLYRALLVRTIGVGFTTACLVTPVAFALAYIMRFVFEKRGALILQLVLLSLFSGYLVRIYAWRTILGKQGLFNETLLWLGITDEPLEFLIYSNFSVVITLCGLILPISVLTIYSAMLNVSRDHLEAARDLGARPVRLIRTVLLPMVLSGFSTAFAFAFLLASGDFVTPTLVGGTQSMLIGNVIADQFRGIGANWPLGAALAFVVVALVFVLYLVLQYVLRLVTRW